VCLTDINLAEARKKTPRSADYARRVRLLHDHGIQVNGSFVLGFDHDGPDCFGRTCDWIEQNRLECATFHILTPYPDTPLFRQMQAEGRLLHTNWERYDTAHVVFRPKRMSAEQLAQGYAWCYERIFSHSSILRRRPSDWRAVLPYLAMSYLYKRGNWFWPVLIRHRLTSAVWRPLVELTRRRHVRYRERLAACDQGLDHVPVTMPAAGRWCRRGCSGGAQWRISRRLDIYLTCGNIGSLSCDGGREALCADPGGAYEAGEQATAAARGCRSRWSPGDATSCNRLHPSATQRR
jgi:hypothetical protein